MTATTTATTVTPELKALLRRLKLGKTLDTLPERLTLARQSKLGHASSSNSSSPTKSTAATGNPPHCAPAPPSSIRP
jgi:hypothetical protein